MSYLFHVFREDTGEHAEIWSDRVGGNRLPNPLVVERDGAVGPFILPPGKYRAEMNVPGRGPFWAVDPFEITDDSSVRHHAWRTAGAQE